MATRTKLDDLTALDTRPEKPKSRKAKAAPKPHRNPVHVWAYCGVGLTLALSGWLNGLAFSSYASVPVNGWVLGVAIPVLVLVFSRVSALCFRSGDRVLAYAGAGATTSILVLSVQHCAVSIARLTGEPVALAALMAFSLDVGLVICEIATVSRKSGRTS